MTTARSTRRTTPSRALIRGRDRKDRASKAHGPLQRLYRGETRFDFVGRRRVWFTISTIIIVAGIVSIILRGGLNLGIEFKGGTEWTVKAPHVTQVQATDAMQAAGLTSPIVQLLGQGSNQQLNVQADLNKLSEAAQKAESLKVEEAIAKLVGTTVENVQNGVETVGPTWGSSITNKAIEALIVFFIVVGIYISIRFEPKMALAAFIAMVHDVLVAVGVYSIFNFQVTPDTVVAILTILGYSLYDTVVVFDRVRDNTKNIGSSGRMTYAQLINLSMNQTLARSINTSAVAIIPVLAVLLVGAELLGAVDTAGVRLGPLRRPLERGLLVDLHRLADPVHVQRTRAALGRHREPTGHAWVSGPAPLRHRRGADGTEISIAAGGLAHGPVGRGAARPSGRVPSARAQAPGTAAALRRVPAPVPPSWTDPRPAGVAAGVGQSPKPRKGKRKRKR